MPSDKHQHVTHSKKEIFINNLWGGLAWGIGATLGLALFLAVLGFIMTQVNLIPFVGKFVSDTYNYILDINPRAREDNLDNTNSFR